MTAPTPATDGGGQGGQDRPRYRAGQVTAFRVVDPTSGDEVSGHALVLRVHGDTADLAVLGAGHVQVHVDNIAPAKVDDVPNPLPAPEPAEGSGA